MVEQNLNVVDFIQIFNINNVLIFILIWFKGYWLQRDNQLEIKLKVFLLNKKKNSIELNILYTSDFFFFIDFKLKVFFNLFGYYIKLLQLLFMNYDCN